MYKELDLEETYAEWKDETEIAWLWWFQTLAEDDGNSSKGVRVLFYESEHSG